MKRQRRYLPKYIIATPTSVLVHELLQEYQEPQKITIFLQDVVRTHTYIIKVWAYPVCASQSFCQQIVQVDYELCMCRFFHQLMAAATLPPSKLQETWSGIGHKTRRNMWMRPSLNKLQKFLNCRTWFSWGNFNYWDIYWRETQQFTSSPGNSWSEQRIIFIKIVARPIR